MQHCRQQSTSVYDKLATYSLYQKAGTTIIPRITLKPNITKQQSSWCQHGAHLGPVGPRWDPCWPHEYCYKGCVHWANMCCYQVTIRSYRRLRSLSVISICIDVLIMRLHFSVEIVSLAWFEGSKLHEIIERLCADILKPNGMYHLVCHLIRHNEVLAWVHKSQF